MWDLIDTIKEGFKNKELLTIIGVSGVIAFIMAVCFTVTAFLIAMSIDIAQIILLMFIIVWIILVIVIKLFIY